MNILVSISTLALSSSLLISNAKALSIADAIGNRTLKVTFENKGGYSGRNTELVIVNNGKSPIEINSKLGTIIASEDSTSQNLILADEIVAIIKPKETFIKKIATYCISPRKSGPHLNEQYFYKTEAEKYLVELIQFINKNKASVPENQHAVWAYVDGNKTVYLDDMKNPKNIALKMQIEWLYKLRLKDGFIKEDVQVYSNNSKSFVLDGIYDLFVKEKGNYAALLVDSLGNQIVLFNNRNLDLGLAPVRYLHYYSSEKEKTFYLKINKDNVEILNMKLDKESNANQYVRYRVKSKTVFNIKNELVANLDVTDSAGNVYLNYFKDQKMYPGIRSFDYSFTLLKAKKVGLFLELKNQNGSTIFKQKISDRKSLMPLQGYAYVRLNRRVDGIFGLFDSKNNLIEVFKSTVFSKGLQMLPYGFVFDAESEESVFLKLIDTKNNDVLYEEKVFAK